MEIAVIAFVVVFIVIFVLVISSQSGKENKIAELRNTLVDEARLKIEEAVNQNKLTPEQGKKLHERIDNNEWVDEIDFRITSLDSYNRYVDKMIDKYGPETGAKIVNDEYWIGMTEEQLIDAKGKPDVIEKEVLKTKTKTTFIYGSKAKGDVFVIENGEVVKFIDR